MLRRLLKWLGHPPEREQRFRVIAYVEGDSGSPKMYAKIYWTHEICDLVMSDGREPLLAYVRRYISSNSLATLAENVRIVIGYSQTVTGLGLYTDPDEQEWSL